MKEELASKQVCILYAVVDYVIDPSIHGYKVLIYSLNAEGLLLQNAWAT